MLEFRHKTCCGLIILKEDIKWTFLDVKTAFV